MIVLADKGEWRVAGRERLESWRGVEIEGALAGTPTFFARSLGAVKSSPCGFPHVYIMREALCEFGAATEIRRLLDSGVAVTLEVPAVALGCVPVDILAGCHIHVVVTIPATAYDAAFSTARSMDLKVEPEGVPFTCALFPIGVAECHAPREYTNDETEEK